MNRISLRMLPSFHQAASSRRRRSYPDMSEASTSAQDESSTGRLVKCRKALKDHRLNHRLWITVTHGESRVMSCKKISEIIHHEL